MLIALGLSCCSAALDVLAPPRLTDSTAAAAIILEGLMTSSGNEMASRLWHGRTNDRKGSRKGFRPPWAPPLRLPQFPCGRKWLLHPLATVAASPAGYASY